MLRREPDNAKDHHAVAVIKVGEVVGHRATICTTYQPQCLTYCNKAFAEVTGARVNQRGGYEWKASILCPKTVCQQDVGDFPVTSGERADI